MRDFGLDKNKNENIIDGNLQENLFETTRNENDEFCGYGDFEGDHQHDGPNDAITTPIDLPSDSFAPTSATRITLSHSFDSKGLQEGFHDGPNLNGCLPSATVHMSDDSVETPSDLEHLFHAAEQSIA